MGSAASNTKCSTHALQCASFATNGLTAWKLHKLVFEARNAKRYAEVICLAELSTNSNDKVLAGASYFEQSHAWEGLGCRDRAISSIESALRVRPSDKNGWKETCERCEALKADCTPCKNVATERIACPSMDRLASIIGAPMLKQAPPDDTWTTPKAEMCTPIGLPQAGWYVIGWVQQEAPDREFWFHVAVDAKGSKVVAISDPEQRKYNYVCETKFGKVTDVGGKPSTVSISVDCMDKMGHGATSRFEAKIVGSKIELEARK